MNIRYFSETGSSDGAFLAEWKKIKLGSYTHKFGEISLFKNRIFAIGDEIIKLKYPKNKIICQQT